MVTLDTIVRFVSGVRNSERRAAFGGPKKTHKSNQNLLLLFPSEKPNQKDGCLVMI